MKVIVIPIEIDALSTVTKGLVQEINGQVETSQTKHCCDCLEYYEESWWLEDIFCHSDSSWKTSANYIYQPLGSGRIWHNVNDFKRSFIGLNSEFSFS